MQDENSDPSDLLGAVNHRYTRAQALTDGVLVEVSKVAQEVGFRVPVAMTAAAWAKAVQWTDEDSRRQTVQDESGRLWDVVWMAIITARRVKDAQRVPFQLHAVPRGGKATRPRPMTLHLHIGPGDEGEPVITILDSNED